MFLLIRRVCSGQEPQELRAGLSLVSTREQDPLNVCCLAGHSKWVIIEILSL